MKKAALTNIPPEELSDRKKRILRAVVDSYIDEGQPVPSKLLQERHFPSISSATVRSELAQLEELGYLAQPHTSAGRVPLPKAYRMYVSELMQFSDLSESEIDYVQSRFDKQTRESEQLVRSAAKLISEMTEYTAVGYVDSGEELIRNIKLVPVAADSVLLIVLTDGGTVKDSMINSDTEGEAHIQLAEQILNRELAGKRLSDAADSEIKLTKQLEIYRKLFEDILKALRTYIRNACDNLVLEGSSNIFKHSEFNDVDKARSFLQVIDSREKLSGLLKGSEGLEICVKIGREAGGLSDDLALVSAQYSLDGKPLGGAGVIGPIRMDYGRVVRVLSLIGKTIGGMSLPVGESGEKLQKKDSRRGHGSKKRD